MEVDEVELKRPHSEDSSGSPDAKRVKYEELEKMMSDTSLSDNDSDNKDRKSKMEPHTRKIQIRRKKFKRSEQHSKSTEFSKHYFRAETGASKEIQTKLSITPLIITCALFECSKNFIKNSRFEYNFPRQRKNGTAEATSPARGPDKSGRVG